MSEKYKFREPTALYFVTLTIVNWIDLFSKTTYCDIVLDSLRYCQKEKDLQIHAWCIMSNHLHLIISSEEKILSEIIRDFKTYTNKEIIRKLKSGNDSRSRWMLNLFRNEANRLKRVSRFKVWRDGNHPVQLYNNGMINVRLNYLHKNPVKAGLVRRDHHFSYSSALDYYGGKGFLEIEKLE